MTGTAGRIRDLATATFAVVLTAAVAAAAGAGGPRTGGVPWTAWLAALGFVVQWVAFVPSFARQTEHFYDLTGSATYLLVSGGALTVAAVRTPRSLVLVALVWIWALRLGTFLFRRVRGQGGDGRFDHIKPNWSRFLMAWTLQGVWVFLTSCAVLAAVTVPGDAPWGLRDTIGVALWLSGFGLEVVADRQKRAWRLQHPKRFIDTGVWAWSRHPNYFGEIVLWLGATVVASSTLAGWRWVSLVSPLFVALLLTRVSGIPLLEARAEKRWGHEPSYRDYCERTPLLLPRPPSRRQP
jgi:steroid 5-alpha reductase family enzyme